MPLSPGLRGTRTETSISPASARATGKDIGCCSSRPECRQAAGFWRTATLLLLPDTECHVMQVRLSLLSLERCLLSEAAEGSCSGTGLPDSQLGGAISYRGSHRIGDEIPTGSEGESRSAPWSPRRSSRSAAPEEAKGRRLPEERHRKNACGAHPAPRSRHRRSTPLPTKYPQEPYTELDARRA